MMRKHNIWYLVMLGCYIIQAAEHEAPQFENHGTLLQAISLEETIQRFYIIQRIDPFIQLMSKLPQEFWSFPPTLYLSQGTLNYEGIILANEHISGIIDAFYKEKSIAPLLRMWGEIKRYKYLHDTSLIKEYVQVLFVLTQYSLCKQYTTSQRMHESLKRVYLIDAVDMLSLDQLLDILDVLVDDLPAFIQKYELNSTMTWKQWFDKYWLVAPLAIGALVLKMYSDYLALKNVQHEQGV